MIWRTSPSLTELETVTLGWLRDALGLPSDLFGIINDTASINSFLALAAAREALGAGHPHAGVVRPRSAAAARLLLGTRALVDRERRARPRLRHRRRVKIAERRRLAMRVDALEEAIARDREAGARALRDRGHRRHDIDRPRSIPFAASREIAKRENVWLHVDAAYAGPATICPEFRWLWDGIEAADSIVVNPHKWLFTPIDCSVLYTRKPEVLRETFSLRARVSEDARYAPRVNYMDYGLQLGRRFRALKLWFLFEHYGVARMQAVIRQHVADAARLAAELQKRDDIELLAPQSLSVVVFRKIVRDANGAIDEAASERASIEALERMNASGRLFVSHTRLRNRYGIRVAIGNGATEWEHVARVLEYL